MNDGTLLTVDDRHVLRFERRLDHSVERVWRAITDPDELRHWFPPEDPIAVTESEPPRLLAGTWFGDPVRFELQPDGEGCVLVFTHTFDDRDTAARSAAGWDSCFRRMEALLGGRADRLPRLARRVVRGPRALREGVRRRPRARTPGDRRAHRKGVEVVP